MDFGVFWDLKKKKKKFKSQETLLNAFPKKFL